ncbi:MAG TPA: MarP family serine protease [Euzebya sp.]|nr:MarP family serine protease [Euzebya sp.]
MNIVDLVLAGALVIAAVRGWRRGALSQVFAFGGAVVGLVVGGLVAPDLASQFVDRPGLSLSLTTIGILLALLTAGQTIGFLLGYRMRDAAHRNGVGVADSVVGVAVGAMVLLVTVWIAGSALAQGPSPALSRQLRDSTVLTALDEALPPPPDLFGRVAAYLDTQGFPQVFAGLGGATAPPVEPPGDTSVAAAAAAGTPATVQVEGLGCGGVSSGSGVAVQPGFIVTNAHVIAGAEVVNVRDAGGTHDAVAVHFDPDLDLAVLSVPTTTATTMPWASVPADRGTAGATLGYPGGQRQLNVRPAAVRGRQEALGRDIYGGRVTSRSILTLSSGVRPGDSGGPFVTEAGEIGGIVFAASTTDGEVGYALTAERVRPDVEAAIARNAAVPTEGCRY